MSTTSDTRCFLEAKVRGLVKRAGRLAHLDPDAVGIGADEIRYAPSEAHFQAARRRLAEIGQDLARPLATLERAMARPATGAVEILRLTALVERQVDRARRAYGLFFDVLSQRATRFAPALAGCDAVAADCYAAVRRAAPGLLPTPLLKPVAYLEPAVSPATFRRGVMLRRLLGEHNPFPLVRIPYERAESPWSMGVVLHEVGHNLQADMHVWHETQAAVARRVRSRFPRPAWLARVWARWHKEIFADLIALLLGGPASLRGMQTFLANPPARVFGFRPLAVHPTAYLRIFISTEMLRRMGFGAEARRAEAIWRDLYGAYLERFGTIPAALLSTVDQIIPMVVDEIAFRSRRGLGQRTLSEVVPFGKGDQAAIETGARALARGRVLPLPPRFVVSASRYAFDELEVSPAQLARLVTDHLARVGQRKDNKVIERGAAPIAAAA